MATRACRLVLKPENNTSGPILRPASVARQALSTPTDSAGISSEATSWPSSGTMLSTTMDSR